MGLINYPELVDGRVSFEDEIESFTRFDICLVVILVVLIAVLRNDNRRYPHIPLKRFFVFNYNFDNPQHSLSSRMRGADNESLVIFPPDGACEGGSMIQVHFQEVLCHSAVKVIQFLEKQMDVCEEARLKNVLPADLPLCSAYDDRDDISISKDAALVTSSAKNKKMFRKKPTGRIRKWMGDLCMQVCAT
jgi:hypothetical protein